MIDYIKGKLQHVALDHIVIENNGLGYRIYTSANSIADFDQVGDEAVVFTEMIVREDSITLVGFSSREELNMFQLLTSVSGVGTKVGIGILSSINFVKVAALIASKDIKALTAAQGVGNKTAERIILELKDKVVKQMHFSENQMLEHIENRSNIGSAESDAIEALMTLGYTKNEAQAVVKLINCEGLTVEDILKKALKQLMTQ